MEINRDAWYKPLTIAKHGLIKSLRGGCSKNFVLREIKSDRLTAKNVGKGRTVYYAVLGSDIIKYNKRYQVL